MFEKKTCERCGTQYRVRTISENKGKYLCHNCIGLCSKCGKNLPRSNYLGETASLGTALLGTYGDIQNESSRKPWVGSGLCNSCYWNEQEILKQAKLKKAQEILETPTIWECGFCKTVNEGKFCSNCGSPRKKELIR